MMGLVMDVVQHMFSGQVCKLACRKRTITMFIILLFVIYIAPYIKQNLKVLYV